MDRKCKCGANINHLHGNADTCINCRPTKKETTTIPFYEEEIKIKVRVFNDLTRKAKIGDEIEKLPTDAREIVEKLLTHWRFMHNV